MTFAAIGVVLWALRIGQDSPAREKPTVTNARNSLAALSISALESILKLPAALPENAITSIDDEAWTARIDAALSDLKATLPADAQAEHLHGLVLLKLKRTKLAEPSLKRAVELDSDNQEMRLDLAELLSQLGRDDEALQVLKGPVRQPLSAKYQMQLGDCQLRLGQLEEAIASFSAVTQADPRQADAWIKLGKAQLQKQLPAECEQSARRAIEQSADNLEAWTLRGRALALLKRPDEAKEALARVKELNAKNAERLKPSFEVAHAQSMSKVYGSAFRSMAILFDTKGNPNKAASMYQLAMQADPEDWVALGKWAALLRKLGEFEQAAQLHKRLVAQQPMEQAHYQNLANMSMELNRPRDAEAALRLACLRMPSNGNCHLILARFLLLLNKPSEAAQAARTAYDILKTDEAAQLLKQIR